MDAEGWHSGRVCGTRRLKRGSLEVKPTGGSGCAYPPCSCARGGRRGRAKRTLEVGWVARQGDGPEGVRPKRKKKKEGRREMVGCGQEQVEGFLVFSNYKQITEIQI